MNSLAMRTLACKLKAVKVEIKFGTHRVTKIITGNQTARTILALNKAQERGVTALELSSWAFRLAEYVRILRHDYDLEIETLREEHDGGWHGRYVLKTPVEILETIER